MLCCILPLLTGHADGFLIEFCTDSKHLRVKLYLHSTFYIDDILTGRTARFFIETCFVYEMTFVKYKAFASGLYP